MQLLFFRYVNKKKGIPMGRIHWLWPILMFACPLKAQKTETLFGTRNLSLSGLWAGRSIHYGLPTGREFYLRGGEFGLEFDRQFVLGWSWQESKEPIIPKGNLSPFTFRNRGIFLSYVPGSHKAIHTRFQLAAGSSLAKVSDQIKERGLNFSPSVGIEANLFSWLKVSAEGGYRVPADFRTPPMLQHALTGLFFQVQIRYGSSWRNANRWHRGE